MTNDNLDNLIEAALYAGAEILSFTPYEKAHPAVVADQFEFQEMLEGLDSETLEALGKWKMEGIAMSTIWYWQKVTLDKPQIEIIENTEEA